MYDNHGKENPFDPSRRNFLKTLPLALSVPLLARFPSEMQEKEPPPKPLTELFEASEWEQLKTSPMALDMENYFGKGYSCAESLLMTALNHLKLPEDRLWASAGFGGGLGQKDLCGFLTAGAMALGYAAGQLKLERREAKKKMSDFQKQYWTWWKETAPLHCAEIRTPDANRDTCRILGVRSAARVNALLDDLNA